MSAPIDHQAAARAGVHRQHDEDTRPKYDGDSSLFPKGSEVMDAERHEADGWGPCEGLALPEIHDAGGWGRTRYWARCPRFACGLLVEGRSEASVERRMREHLGTLR